jgi:hypothetical protein
MPCAEARAADHGAGDAADNGARRACDNRAGARADRGAGHCAFTHLGVRRDGEGGKRSERGSRNEKFAHEFLQCSGLKYKNARKRIKFDDNQLFSLTPRCFVRRNYDCEQSIHRCK